MCSEPIIAERYSKFTEQTGNKNAKKGKFQDAADLLSEGAGTDILLLKGSKSHNITPITIHTVPAQKSNISKKSLLGKS